MTSLPIFDHSTSGLLLQPSFLQCRSWHSWFLNVMSCSSCQQRIKSNSKISSNYNNGCWMTLQKGSESQWETWNCLQMLMRKMQNEMNSKTNSRMFHANEKRILGSRLPVLYYCDYCNEPYWWHILTLLLLINHGVHRVFRKCHPKPRWPLHWLTLSSRS